jgi:hypothetical protein
MGQLGHTAHIMIYVIHTLVHLHNGDTKRVQYQMLGNGISATTLRQKVGRIRIGYLEMASSSNCAVRLLPIDQQQPHHKVGRVRIRCLEMVSMFPRT